MSYLKEHIYTIPINECFDKQCECPICLFIENEEQKRIEYILGASMMEPNERIVYNKKGFCKRHSGMMYEFGNRLSHSLILESRTEYLSNLIENFIHKLNHTNGNLFFFGSKKDNFNSKEKEAIAMTSNSCVICERINKTEADFIDNILYLYKNDEDFKTKFLKSKGFCLYHFNSLVEASVKHFSFDDCKAFLFTLCEIEKDSIDRINCDVKNFSKTFDYRYQTENLSTAKDAVQRGCQKISGYNKEYKLKD